MSKYVEKALVMHSKGYNCAQAVACAFAEKLNMDESVLYKIAEGFGAGIGNRKYACGALSGAVMLVGCALSNGDVSNSSKFDTYKISGKVADTFAEKCMAVNCMDIKGIESGNPTVSCSECIEIAVNAVSDVLGW